MKNAMTIIRKLFKISTIKYYSVGTTGETGTGASFLSGFLVSKKEDN